MARTAPEDSHRALAFRVAACLVAVVSLLLVAAVPAGANADRSAPATAQSSSLKKQRAKRRAAQRRHRRLRRARAGRAQVSRAISLSPNSAVAERKVKAPVEPGALDAGCDGSLLNWNTAGVGDAVPTLANDTVRSGSGSCRVALSGTQDRSELILGGNGGGSTSGMVEFHEGDEYWYGFSFYIVSMVYGGPGAHNLIMQFKGDDDGSPAFGLQLWDYEGDDGEYAGDSRGLWSHGPSMDGDRFLAPVAEHTWHDMKIHFRASASGAGFYELYLDGSLIDSRSGVSMIADGADFAYIKDGIYRNGDDLDGTSELRLDAAKLGHSLADVS